MRADTGCLQAADRLSWCGNEKRLHSIIKWTAKELSTEDLREPWRYRLLKANALIGLKQPNKAVEELKMIRGQCKNDYRLYVTAARAFAALGERDHAIKSLRRAAALVTDKYLLHSKLVWLLKAAQAGEDTDRDYNLARVIHIGDLPLEIFTCIIEQLNNTSKLQAMEVCRSWRKIILSTPRLWRSLSLIKYQARGAAFMRKLITKRSEWAGGALHHVFLGKEEKASIVPTIDHLQALASHSLRTLHLAYKVSDWSRHWYANALNDLCLIDRFPNLSDIKIRSTQPSRTLPMPKLIRREPFSDDDELVALERYDVDDPESAASLSALLPALVKLALSVSLSSRENVLQILQHSTRLTHVDLHWLPNQTERVLAATAISIDLRRLEELSISSVDDAFGDGVDQLYLPKLRTLSLKCSPQLLRIFQAPRLRKFAWAAASTRNIPADVEPMWEWLRDRPQVRTLKLTISHHHTARGLRPLIIDGNEQNVSDPAPPAVLVPRLQSLACGTVDVPPEEWIVRSIVRSRLMGSKGKLHGPRIMKTVRLTEVGPNPFSRGLGSQTLPRTKCVSEPQIIHFDQPFCTPLHSLHFEFPADGFNHDCETWLRKIVPDVTFLPKPTPYRR